MSRPTLIKIKEGVMVNLNNIISVGAERDMQLTKLKEGITKGEKADDYVAYNVDCVCFHYINSSLYFRVGFEITAEDFERMVRELDFLQFKLYERKPSTSKDTVPTA